jgi:hypothetical protein
MKPISDATVETSLQLQEALRAAGVSVSSLVAVRFVGGRVGAVQPIALVTPEMLAHLGNPLEWD